MKINYNSLKYFLSENSDFAEIVEAHNIVFIGPKPEHIKCMGDKIQAKITLLIIIYC